MTGLPNQVLSPLPQSSDIETVSPLQILVFSQTTTLQPYLTYRPKLDSYGNEV